MYKYFENSLRMIRNRKLIESYIFLCVIELHLKRVPLSWRNTPSQGSLQLRNIIWRYGYQS